MTVPSRDEKPEPKVDPPKPKVDPPKTSKPQNITDKKGAGTTGEKADAPGPTEARKAK